MGNFKQMTARPQLHYSLAFSDAKINEFDATSHKFRQDMRCQRCKANGETFAMIAGIERIAGMTAKPALSLEVCQTEHILNSEIRNRNTTFTTTEKKC